MNAFTLALNQFIGIERDSAHHLILQMTPNVQNHMGSIHAGAQFVLAESASGAYLAEKFPELEDKVIPILRDSAIKYSKPATGMIYAVASVDDETITRFTKQYERKKRATITVNVAIVNAKQETTTSATFTWFIQAR